jgi:hypothetical protein
MVLVYPQLSKYDFVFFRFLGSGLGNLLFPWARSVSLGNRYGLPIIYPTWPQIKFGSYWRREKDKRHYRDLFSPTTDYVTGSKRFKYLATSPSVSEGEFLEDPSRYVHAKEDYVVRVTGIRDFFLPILHDHELIKKKLIDIVQPKHIPQTIPGPCIAAHVRLGDFKVGRQTTPIDFFDNMLSQLKAHLPDFKVVIFTDGESEEVDRLLRTYEATLPCHGSSVADMLAMASAKLLVASKNSCFSWWASYLGRMPVIWPRDTWTFPIYGGKQIELYLDENAKIFTDLFRSIRGDIKETDATSHALSAKNHLPVERGI